MKRRVLIAAIFLLLGAILNVAVAWGCAILLTVDPNGSPSVRTSLWWGRVRGGEDMWCGGMTLERPGAWQCWTDWFNDLRLISDVRLVSADPNILSEPTLPAWAYAAVLAHERTPWTGTDLIIDARGWPLLSLYSQADLDLHTIANGWPLSKAEGLSSNWYVFTNFALPLRPIWPGFAINTLFYAAILWLPIRGPLALRRHIRRKRGLCVACGYDLRHAKHDACPECGAVIGPAVGASG